EFIPIGDSALDRLRHGDGWWGWSCGRLLPLVATPERDREEHHRRKTSQAPDASSQFLIQIFGRARCAQGNLLCTIQRSWQPAASTDAICRRRIQDLWPRSRSCSFVIISIYQLYGTIFLLLGPPRWNHHQQGTTKVKLLDGQLTLEASASVAPRPTRG